GGDRHDLADQIGRVVAGEHRDGGRDLPDLGGAAVGLTGGEVVEQFLAGDLREEGVAGDGRGDGVDAHAVFGGLDRGAAGQGHDAGLRRRVVRLRVLGAPAEYRRVVDEHAVVVDRAEVAQCRAGRAEGAGEGDVEDAIPFLVGHLDDGRLPTESSVVDEHVDAP